MYLLSKKELEMLQYMLCQKHNINMVQTMQEKSKADIQK